MNVEEAAKSINGEEHPLFMLAHLVKNDREGILKKLDKFLIYISNHSTYNVNQKIERTYHALLLKHLITGEAVEMFEVLNCISEQKPDSIAWKVLYYNFDKAQGRIE